VTAANPTTGANGEPTVAFPAVQPGDAVRLRKAHPCGSRDWTVTRIGADIGLECAGCGRRVLLTRDDFERRCVRHTAAPVSGEAASG
jgi:hypothetical protein